MRSLVIWDWVRNRFAAPRIRASAIPASAPRNSDDDGPVETGKPAFDALGVLALIVLGAGFVAVLEYGVPPPALKIGSRAPNDIIARVDFQIDDPDWVERRRGEAAEKTPPVFRQEQAWAGDVLRDLRRLCDVVERSRDLAEAQSAAVDFQVERALVDELYEFNKANAQQAQPLSTLLLPHLDSVLRGLSRRGVISQKDYDELSVLGVTEIVRVDALGRRETLSVDLLKPIQVPTAIRQGLEAKKDSGVIFPDSLQRQLYGYLEARSLRPNLTRDDDATKELRDHARANVKDEPRRYQSSDLLVSKGQRVSSEGLRLLNEHAKALKQSLPESEWLLRLFGLASLVAAVMAIAWAGLRRVEPEFTARRRALMMLGLTALFVLAFTKVLVLYGLPRVLAPVSIVTVIASLAFTQGVALICGIGLSLLVGFAAGGDLALALCVLAGATVSALPSRNLLNRFDLIKYGLYGGLAQGAVALGLAQLGSDAWGAPTLELAGQALIPPSFSEALWGLLNPVFCGLLLLGALPLIETVFGIITNIRLFELCDQNQPALRRIALEAPGTWAHTLQVAALSEPAAEAIGANARLVRAGVYYHDLGKTLKPEYFVENQMGAEELHRRLSPTVSALIILAHVKDGIELAREYSLPQQIVDFIAEHHGTTLVSYFYHSARRQAEADKGGAGAGGVHEGFFRYPGPKPGTRETAIAMLADTIEAATRTLESPSATRLRTFVHELIMAKLLDGQLDESDLTFKDLAVLEEVFLRVLVSRFHSRVRYPGQVESERGEVEAVDNADAPDSPTPPVLPAVTPPGSKPESARVGAGNPNTPPPQRGGSR